MTADMVGFLVRAAMRMLALAGLVYVVFFVPIGEHTLYRHGARIASTREARELWVAVATAAERAHQQLEAFGKGPAAAH